MIYTSHGNFEEAISILEKLGPSGLSTISALVFR